MGFITFLRQTVASVAAPAAGKTALLIDSTSKQLALKDDSGNTILVGSPPGTLPLGALATMTANSGSINTTETVVLNALIPAGLLRTGTTFQIKGHGQGSGSTTGNGTVAVRMGTVGTTADTQVVASGLLALTVAAVGFAFHGLITVHTIGVGGTVGGNVDGGVSGVVPVVSNNTGTGTVNTTVANFIDVTVKTSVTTNSIIVTDCAIIVVAP